MKLLGALLAGGKSKRYGSDKAFAVYRGQYLIDHALGLLGPQCDAIVICGRAYKDYEFVKDFPEDNGPLGGLNAALKYAKERHYDAVISFPCDTIMGDTIAKPPKHKIWFESGEAAYFADQPVIGYWPCTLSDTLEHWLQSQKRRSMMAWVEYLAAKHDGIKAIAMDSSAQFINVNRPDDLIS